MNLKDKKEKLLKWVDFYGQEITDTDQIKKAKTNSDIKEILKQHKRFLEDQNVDATTHLDQFLKELGLY